MFAHRTTRRRVWCVGHRRRSWHSLRSLAGHVTSKLSGSQSRWCSRQWLFGHRDVQHWVWCVGRMGRGRSHIFGRQARNSRLRSVHLVFSSEPSRRRSRRRSHQKRFSHQGARHRQGRMGPGSSGILGGMARNSPLRRQSRLRPCNCGRRQAFRRATSQRMLALRTTRHRAWCAGRRRRGSHILRSSARNSHLRQVHPGLSSKPSRVERQMPLLLRVAATTAHHADAP